MAASARFELAHVRVKVWCLTTWLQGKHWWEEVDSNHRVPESKSGALTTWLHPKEMVGGGRFELPNPKEQIYSLPRLATSLPSHMWIYKDGAGSRTWTRHLLITSQLLYQMSYSGKWWRLTGSNRWPSACKADALPTELNLHLPML